MRHNNKINHLGRTHSHRDAMLSNMAVSLIKHKRIFTTLAKAKELRKYVEPLITKCKEDTTHSRRVVFQSLRDKYAVTELFTDVSQKIGERPGGYTRIIKTGNRLGDNASMCFIELVDYNDLMLKDKKAQGKAKTRRSRKKSDSAAVVTDTPKTPTPKKKTVKETPTKAPVAKTPKAPIEEAPAVETSVEEVVQVAETSVEEVVQVAETSVDEVVTEEVPENETSVEEVVTEEVPENETSVAVETESVESEVLIEKTPDVPADDISDAETKPQ